jgi:hypothetical protein
MASGQVNMRDARVEDVDHVSDSDNDDKDESGHGDVSSDAFTVGIFPSHQSPIYLHLATKQEKVCVNMNLNSILLVNFLSSGESSHSS